MVELGRSTWIRRERLERIATAERDRRAGHTALAIAALGEAIEWPARTVLALALLPASEGRAARRVLEEGLDQWALEAGLPSLDALELIEEEEASIEAPSGAAFALELDSPLEAGELERAFAEAEAQVDEMHDVNQVAERILFAGDFDLADLPGEELDPLEQSARMALSNARARTMDAASVPPLPAASDWDVDSASGRPSRAVVQATLERWLSNLARHRAGGMQ